MKKISKYDLEIINELDLPIHNARIYENGTLLYEGEHKQYKCYHSFIDYETYLILDKTGEYILIEPSSKLTFVYIDTEKL